MHLPPSLDELTPTAIPWLWPGYLARGKLTLLDGDPGTGKSLLTADLAARLSRGGPLPDGTSLDRPQRTLLLAAEDDPHDTIAPRLRAAGGDLAHVFAYGRDTQIQVPRDLAELDGIVAALRVDLLVLDPLLAYLPPQVAANNDQCVRLALAPLAVLAAQRRCAVLLVRHLNKSGGARALYRGSGSIGIIGTMRTAFLLARHPTEADQRVLAPTKSNVGELAAALACRVVAGPLLDWLGPCTLSGDDLLQPAPTESAPPERVVRDAAAEWLRAALAAGPRPASEVLTEGVTAGHSSRTLHRARLDLGIVSEIRTRNGRRCNYWYDPLVTLPPPSVEELLAASMEEGKARIARCFPAPTSAAR